MKIKPLKVKENRMSAKKRNLLVPKLFRKYLLDCYTFYDAYDADWIPFSVIVEDFKLYSGLQPRCPVANKVIAEECNFFICSHLQGVKPNTIFKFLEGKLYVQGLRRRNFKLPMSLGMFLYLNFKFEGHKASVCTASFILNEYKNKTREQQVKPYRNISLTFMADLQNAMRAINPFFKGSVLVADTATKIVMGLAHKDTEKACIENYFSNKVEFLGEPIEADHTKDVKKKDIIFRYGHLLNDSLVLNFPQKTISDILSAMYEAKNILPAETAIEYKHRGVTFIRGLRHK